MLNKMEATIIEIQTALTSEHVQQKKLLNTLKNTEIAIGQLGNEMQRLNKEINTQQLQLKQLTEKKRQYLTEQNATITTLSEEVRALYLSQKNHNIQNIFTEQNIRLIRRNLTYFHYLNEAQIANIKKLDHQLRTLIQLQKQIETTEKKLQDTLHMREEEKQQLRKLQSGRAKILTGLSSDITEKQNRLKQLTENKAELDKLLKRLNAHQHSNVQPPLPLNAMHNKLNWPVEGKVIQNFDTPIDGTQLKSTGVVISAPAGTPIYAIYPGKVIFSNWLKGYGLLIIVDHGNGYWSLYGRNNSLYHQVGDFVNRGDMIATVGNSGGFNEVGLYFEVRKDGQPVDPGQWCQQVKS